MEQEACVAMTTIAILYLCIECLSWSTIGRLLCPRYYEMMIPVDEDSSNDDVNWAELVTEAEQGQTNNILRLLTKDPDFIYTTNAAGDTLLHELARIGNVDSIFEVMQFLGKPLLIEMLHKQNTNGNTPLHLAFKNMHQEAACLLLKEHGIAVFEPNDHGISCWELAERAGYSKVLEKLPQLVHSGISDIEMSLARRDLFCVEEPSRVEVKWIELIPKDVRFGCLMAFYGVNRPEELQSELDAHGGNLLHIAARRGRVDLLKLLVKFMPSSSSDESTSLPLERDLYGNTPLHIALQGRHEIAALYLIELAPMASYLLNYNEISPLYWAIKFGYEHMVRYIFQLSPPTFIDSSLRRSLLNTKKASVVHAAVRARNIGILERIMKDLPSSIDSLNERGWKPLSYAAYNGFLEEVHYFIAKFPNSVKKYDRDGSFPIHKAVCSGQVGIVKEFISSCPSTMHYVDKKGRSILHIAIRYARADVFSYLTKIKEVEKIFHLKDQDGKTFMDFATELRNGFGA